MQNIGRYIGYGDISVDHNFHKTGEEMPLMHIYRPEDDSNLKKTLFCVSLLSDFSLFVFQALGCCYFIHESLKNIQQFDFKGTCVPLIRRVINPIRSSAVKVVSEAIKHAKME